MSERRPVGRGPRIAGARRRAVGQPAAAETTPAEVADAPVTDAPVAGPAEPAPAPPAPVEPDAEQAEPPAQYGVEPEPAGEDEPSRSVPVARLVALALVVALLLTAVVLLALRRERQADVRVARTDAVAAAREAAPKVLSYDYRRLDADFAAAREVMTERFREEYDRTSSAAVRPLAAQVQGVVAATVTGAAVVSAEPDTVRLLLFVNQASTKTTVEGTQLDQARVEMTLRLVDGTWLVDEVRAV